MKNALLTLKKKLHNATTSKIIICSLFIYIILLTPIVTYIAILGNADPLTETVRGVFVLTSIAVGFYYWKAKCENLHKYKQDDKITMNGE